MLPPTDATLLRENLFLRQCFKGGVMCGDKCKCQGCSNYPGSQKLIDARRKMKDSEGARMAMEAAQQVWRGQHNPSAGNPPDVGVSNHHPMGNLHPRHPQDRISHPHHLPPHHRPFYSRPPHPHPYHGYSRVGMPPHGEQYPDPRRRHPASIPMPPKTISPSQEAALKRENSNSIPSPAFKRSAAAVTATPRNLPLAKKLKTSPLQPTTNCEAFFGSKVPTISRKTAVEIISFLGSEEIQAAALVCKSWKSLVHDAAFLQLPKPKV